MTTKTNVKYRMSVMKEQRNFFHVQFDELKTAEAFGRSCVREKDLNNKQEHGHDGNLRANRIAVRRNRACV